MHVRPALKRLERQLAEALRLHLDGAAPRPPEAGRLIWGAFCQLSEERRWADKVPLALTLAAIEAWGRVQRLELRPDHVAMIKALDRVWMADAARRLTKPEAAAASAPVTAAGFDAMFA